MSRIHDDEDGRERRLRPESTPPGSSLREQTLLTMQHVLGVERAEVVMESLLAELKMELETVDDLARFAEAMSQQAGFEGAVGSMLALRAMLQGGRR